MLSHRTGNEGSRSEARPFTYMHSICFILSCTTAVVGATKAPRIRPLPRPTGARLPLALLPRAGRWTRARQARRARDGGVARAVPGGVFSDGDNAGVWGAPVWTSRCGPTCRHGQTATSILYHRSSSSRRFTAVLFSREQREVWRTEGGV